MFIQGGMAETAMRLQKTRDEDEVKLKLNLKSTEELLSATAAAHCKALDEQAKTPHALLWTWPIKIKIVPPC